MPTNAPSPNVCELELRILRAICNHAGAGEDWERLASRLARHDWRDPEHAVVYNALRQIRGRDATFRREQLPAQATRMGFPEVDWDLYLKSGDLPEDGPESDAEGLIRKLEAEVGRKT